MFNFTLNNFFTGHNINNFFVEYTRLHPEALINPNTRFNQIEGTIPYNIWGGVININHGQNITSYNKLGEMFLQEMLSPRLDFSSVVLQTEDFENNYNRVILEQGNNGATYITVSNLQLYEFIKQNYPYYKNFVLSENAWAITDITPEMLNCILENEDFKLVTLPDWIATEEYISQIKYKNKLEVIVNPKCPKCKIKTECIINESNFIYNFSEKSMMNICPKKCNYAQRNFSFNEITNRYMKMGVTHFKVTAAPVEEMGEYFNFLVSFFLKKEYQDDILKTFISSTFG